MDATSDPAYPPDAGSPDPLGSGALQALLPGVVTADIVQLLDLGLRIHCGKSGGWRALSPGDIAVLVRKSRQARAVQAALLEAGVPCVLPGADTVLATDEARDLLLWLRAVQSPGSDRAARAAVTTPMFGRTAASLLALDRPETPPADNAWWDRWLGQLAAWRVTLDKHGVLRAFRAAMQQYGVQATLLAWPDGERRLTNLLHLLELLHAAQVQDHLRIGGLIRWLASQRMQAELDAETGELRLERDDEAVRILTMHKSKGLQFPVVFAPYLWDGSLLHLGDKDAPVVSRAEGSTQRLLDVHVDPTVEPKRSRLALAERETWQEGMRLLYVALTRTQQRCVVYDAHVTRLDTSPLGTLLHAFPPGVGPGTVGDRLAAAKKRVPTLGSAQLQADLAALAKRAGAEAGLGPRAFVSRCRLQAQAPRWTPRTPARYRAHELQARVFERRGPQGRSKGLDRVWRRTSYTSIARSRSRAHDASIEQAAGALDVVSEQQALAKDHDQDLGVAGLESSGLDPAREARLRAALPVGPVAQAQVPLAGFPAGTQAGSFLHELFEHLDFTAFAHEPEDAEGQRVAQQELLRVLAERAPLHGFDGPHWRDLLLEALPPVLRTPLGGSLGSLRLADIPAGRRLNELVFDLPLAGGDGHRRPDASGALRFTQRISGRDFGEAFLLGRGDSSLRDAYLEQLAKGWENQRFAGYLTGSIDLVFASPAGPESAERFWVVDYKSNRLDLLRERSTPRAHFCAPWMRHEMEHHDYVVQYHLYCLALHRYLDQRVPGYHPDVHLGGALYLFLRGMAGPECPPGSEHPYGVFFHRPSTAVIQRLDQLFAGAQS